MAAASLALLFFLTGDIGKNSNQGSNSHSLTHWPSHFRVRVFDEAEFAIVDAQNGPVEARLAAAEEWYAGILGLIRVGNSVKSTTVSLKAQGLHAFAQRLENANVPYKVEVLQDKSAKRVVLSDPDMKLVHVDFSIYEDV